MNSTSAVSDVSTDIGVIVEVKQSQHLTTLDLKTHILIGLLILVSQTILAGYTVVSVLYTKNEEINVYIFTFFRGVLSIPVTLSLAAVFEKGLTFPSPPFKLELCYFIIVGFMVNYLVSVLYLQAIILTTASYCSIFAQLVPIFTCIFNYSFKIEPLSSIYKVKGILQVMGIITGFSFALSIVILQFTGFGESQTAQNIAIGTLLIICDYSIFSIPYIIQTKLFYRNPNSCLKKRPLTAQAYSVSFGFIPYLIFFIPYSVFHFQEFYKISLKIIIPLLYTSLLLCPVSYGLMAYCSKKLSPLMVGSSYPINIVIVLILLRIFTNEKLRTIIMILFFGVLAGAFMVLFAPLVDKYIQKSKPKLEHDNNTDT